ncbi:MAG TPA: citrate/2-methylcitrate synthase [Tepidisphaeraceae bacterium]|nr:citrate/2-methylcitrate synthase [Tepidisphaeraceae bacterium]
MSTAVTSAPAKPAGGLEGVVAAKSDICFIDGNAGRLVYQGYEIGDLVENTTFEEVAFLLWEGRLPNKTELAELHKELAANTALPSHVERVIEAMPKDALPMDVLRTAAMRASFTACE